jgi:hypothetical protein
MLFGGRAAMVVGVFTVKMLAAFLLNPIRAVIEVYVFQPYG